MIKLWSENAGFLAVILLEYSERFHRIRVGGAGLERDGVGQSDSGRLAHVGSGVVYECG